MSSKKIAYILMSISFFLIVSGSVSQFLIGLRLDHSLTNQRMLIVSDQFEEFSTNISIFEEEREKLYEEVLSNLYLETMEQTDLQVKNRISAYENIINGIEIQTKKLAKLCNDAYYPNSDINNKCSNYKIIYEQAINYFVNDINLYNKTIAEFNKTAGTNLLNKYKTTKKYIDYNKDGNYEGKEDDNENTKEKK